MLNCYAEVRRKEEKPNYFKANYKVIRERLSLVNWTTELHGDFIISYTKFINILESSMEGWIPNYNNKQKVKNIYLTPEVTRTRNQKNKLWHKTKQIID